MNTSDFHYDLPAELIAQAPLAQRSASRLLVADARDGSLVDRHFSDLPDYLRPGDLLVFNDTRVLPARLFGRKETGGAVEILIERITGEHTAVVQLGVSKKPKPGSRIVLGHGSAATVLAKDEGFYHLQFEDDEPLEAKLGKLGRMPLPPYIKREKGRDARDDLDRSRYQTVFAREPGSVEQAVEARDLRAAVAVLASERAPGGGVPRVRRSVREVAVRDVLMNVVG